MPTSAIAGTRRRAKAPLRRPAAALLARAARTRPAGLGLALCYHCLGPVPGRAGRELVPALDTRAFTAHLRHLRAAYRPVRAGDLLEAAASRRRGQRIPVALTFDDDLASHAAFAAPLLREAAVSATFFLGGGALDGPRAFWWQALQRALDLGLSPRDPLLPRVEAPEAPGGVHRLADAVRRLERGEREALTAALLERIGGEPPEPGLAADAVRALAAGGFEIGFHTREHESLDLLDDDALAAALRTGRDRLEELAGYRLRTLAYPFGCADSRVAAAARAAGFETGFTLVARPFAPGDDPLLLGRFQPDFAGPGQTAMGLARPLTRLAARGPGARSG